MDGKKPLGLASRFESAHVPFPLAGWLMRGFGAIVGVTFRALRTNLKIMSGYALTRTYRLS